MATMTVKDASNADQTVEKPNANGQAAMAASRPVVIASDQSTLNVANVAGTAFIGTVGNLTKVITTTITGSTSPAYSSGDLVGGKITWANAVRANGGSAIVQSVHLFSKIALTQQFDVFLFGDDPTNTTFTDNGAFAISTSDWDKMVGHAKILDWAGATPSSGQAILGLPVVCTATSLFGGLVVRGTPTLTSTTDIRVVVKLLQMD